MLRCERAFLSFCVQYLGFAYGIFMQVIPRRETLCQGRASVQSVCIFYDLIGLKLTIKDVCCCRVFGSSDEASGEVRYLCG